LKTAYDYGHDNHWPERIVLYCIVLYYTYYPVEAPWHSTIGL
jgi:hypothetical protein